MAEIGYIKLSRKLFADPAWTFDRIAAWADLIQMANWGDGERRVNGYALQLRRGQFAVSVRYLADRWSWHRRRVETFLGWLQKTGRIAGHSSGHWAGHRPSVYRIVKYDTYQGGVIVTGTQTGTQTGTNANTNTKAVKATTRSKASRETWVSPYCTAWDTKNGPGTYKPVLGLMLEHFRGLDRQYGPEVVARHLSNYLKRTDPDYVSIPRFVSTFAQWDSGLTPQQQREVEETKRMFADPTVHHA